MKMWFTILIALIRFLYPTPAPSEAGGNPQGLIVPTQREIIAETNAIKERWDGPWPTMYITAPASANPVRGWSDYYGLKADGWVNGAVVLVPPFKTTDEWKYVLAHEIGHQIDYYMRLDHSEYLKVAKREHPMSLLSQEERAKYDSTILVREMVTGDFVRCYGDGEKWDIAWAIVNGRYVTMSLAEDKETICKWFDSKAKPR